MVFLPFYDRSVVKLSADLRGKHSSRFQQGSSRGNAAVQLGIALGGYCAWGTGGQTQAAWHQVTPSMAPCPGKSLITLGQTIHFLWCSNLAADASIPQSCMCLLH